MKLAGGFVLGIFQSQTVCYKHCTLFVQILFVKQYVTYKMSHTCTYMFLRGRKWPDPGRAKFDACVYSEFGR